MLRNVNSSLDGGKQITYYKDICANILLVNDIEHFLNYEIIQSNEFKFQALFNPTKVYKSNRKCINKSIKLSK